jgi:hypothetical protein
MRLKWGEVRSLSRALHRAVFSPCSSSRRRGRARTDAVQVATGSSHSMRIAQIAPLFEAVPPKRYGGTERVVHWLTEELVALGHDVTLFASGDSITSAELVPVRETAQRFARNFEENNAHTPA